MYVRTQNTDPIIIRALGKIKKNINACIKKMTGNLTLSEIQKIVLVKNSYNVICLIHFLKKKTFLYLTFQLKHFVKDCNKQQIRKIDDDDDDSIY